MSGLHRRFSSKPLTRQKQGIGQAEDRDRDAAVPAHPDDDADQRFELAPPSGFHVPLQTGFYARGRGIDEFDRPLDDVRVESDAGGPADGGDFLQGGPDYGPRLGDVPIIADGDAGQDPYGAGGGDEDELGPEDFPDVGRQFGFGSGRPKGFDDGSNPRRFQSIQLARDDPAEGAVLADDSGRLDGRRKPCGASDQAMRAGDSADLLGGVDAVEKRQDRRLRAQEGQNRPGRGGEIVGLDGEEDEIDRADFGRIFHRPGFFDDEIAMDALDPQPVLLNRPQMLPAGDERDVLPGPGQQRPIVTADSARPHDRDFHDPIILSVERPI